MLFLFDFSGVLGGKYRVINRLCYFLLCVGEFLYGYIL